MSDTLRHLAVCLATALILMSPGIPRVNAREMVAFSGYAPGMIVGKTGQRRLYYVVDDRRALRFPVGVGRVGMAWSGSARIEGKYVRPAWPPPDMIRAENPNLPEVIPGGAVNNPMGAAALTRRRVRDPRHQSPRFDRRLRFTWLHPHVQQRYPRALPVCKRRHAGARRAVVAAKTVLC